MRIRKKRIMIPALVLALLIVAAVFLPAGAATTTSAPEGDMTSQEFVLCETDASGVIEKVSVYNMLSVAGKPGGGSVDFKMTNEFAGEDGAKVAGTSSFKAPELDGDYIVWKDVDSSKMANYVADTKFSKSMVEEARSRIPLDVEYRYYFDGKLVAGPDAIAGKDGHFRLECTMKNISKEKTPVKYKDPDTGETVVINTDVYLPLVIVPYMWQFDNQHFFNMETDQYCINVYKPDVYQTGWTIPLFPPATDEKVTIWVEADVKDFRMPALTLVCAFVFPHTNQNDALEQLGPGIAQLYDGVKQLDGGLTEAVAGLGSAATPDTLIYGISQIYDGLLTLSSNTEGLGAAKEGLDAQLIPGVDQMIPGVDQLYGGADQVIGGLDQIKTGVGDPTNPQSLMGGLTGISQGIGSTTTADSLLWAVDQMTSGLHQLADGMEIQLAGAIDQIMAGLSHAPTSAADPGGVKEVLQLLSGSLGTASTPGTLIYGLQAGADALSPTNPAGIYAAVYGAQVALSPGTGTTLYDYVNAIPVTDPAWSAPGGYEAFILGTFNTLAGYLSSASGGINTLWHGLTDPFDPATGTGGAIGALSYIRGVLDTLANNAIGTPATPDTLLFGLNEIKGGIMDIVNDVIGGASTENSLLYAMARVQFGLVQIQGGIDNELLTGLAGMSAGVDQLIAGETMIKYGLSSGSSANPGLKEGLVQVSGGLYQLSGGLGTAIAGLGSASTPDTLLYGTNLVKEGMGSLQEGLTQATTEGTQVMLTGLDGSLTTINLTQGELEAIEERAAEYTSFLGAPVEGDSEVRFIMQTPPTYGYSDSSTGGWIALGLSLAIAIGLALLGFFAFRKLA